MTLEPRSLEYGTIADVSELQAGDELAADAAAGALALSVGDAVDFNEDGGSATLDGLEVIVYASADLETDELELAAPLATAWPAGTPVLVSPISVERRALVQLDIDGEAVDARVPHALFDRLALGTREVGERVALSLDGSEWVIEDVLGKEPVVDGSYITPDTLPSAEPTEPPASSPALTVSGVTNGLVVRSENVDPGTLIAYHITDTPPLDASGDPLPFEPTAATQLGDPTRATVLVVTELPDGTALVADRTYYLRAVASNVAGTAPPGPDASGELNLETVSELVSAQVTAGFLLAGSIQVGQITIDPDTGITIPTEGGGIVLPSDGGEATFSGTINTGSITVEDHLTINGESNGINGTLLLANVVEAPDTPPEVGWQWPSAGTIGEDSWGFTESLDRTEWVSVGWFTDRVWTFRKSDGVRTRNVDIGNYYLHGITRGNDSFYFALVKDRSNANYLTLLKLDADFNITRTGTIAKDASVSKNGAIGVDHTTGHILTAYCRNNGEDVVVRHHSTADLTQQTATPTYLDYAPSGVLNGTPHDLAGIQRLPTGAGGAAEWWVSLSGSLVRHAADSPPAPQPWVTRPEGVKGLHYDGTRLWSLGYSSYKVWKWSTNQWPAETSATYTWYDSDPAGSGTHETPPSPSNSYQPPPFAFFRVKQPIPADAGDVDSPDTARIYLDNHLQPPGEPYAQYLLYESVDETGVPAPTANSFDNASSTPGRISSAAQDAAGPLIDLHGDGTARLPGLPPSGSIVMWAGGTAPAGWLLCQGQAVSTALYPKLYEVIGFTFGGSGSTFYLPDLRGRFPFGASPGALKGEPGDHETGVAGAAPGASDPARLDHRHSHSISANNSTDGHSKAAGTTTPNVLALRAFDGHNHGGSTGSSGVAGLNTQYHGFLTLNFIIKA